MGKGDRNPEPIPASPAKSFFVDMITRDIELQDAVLDLLDNCVDGIRRSNKKSSNQPYAGYYAHITFADDKFIIEDNCGGIPLKLAKQYAFMMGRPAKHKETIDGTIGVYGIGMKRAIFKMGRACVVHSHHEHDTFDVKIADTWLDDDHDWDLKAVHVKPDLTERGTRITVSKLHSVIGQEFAEGSDFRKNFVRVVRNAYSFLLEKGFAVKVNGEAVEPDLPKLLWDTSTKGEAIRPYIYEAEIDSVSIFLVVGFRERPETDDDSDSNALYRSEDAGWSVVCNDRVILPFDRTRQTGWGWGGVPSYHPQFIAISGFVLFEGDPSKLPMTTTKRGVDANSEVYTIVREQMQEGILHFTKFTNEWKGLDISKLFREADALAIPAIKRRAKKEKLSKLSGDGEQSQFLPHLPKRPKAVTEKRISFVRPITQIKAVSMFLFDTEDGKANDVGAECFDFIFRKTK